ncbi:MAG: YihY/virulence factor BrkB family protein [Saprospiraceae bacterium]|nr:YihY/virulence factor BrkB family protein [Saprospiraceae bacterium]
MANKYLDKVLSWKPIKSLIAFLKKLILPGFDRVPIFDVGAFFVKGIQKSSISTRAAATSYNFFLAVFPAILFFFTIIPYLPIDNFQEILMGLLADILPQSAFETISSTVEDIVGRKHGSLLSVGVILALYFSTKGIRSLIEAFNDTYHFDEKRSFIKVRLVSIFLVIIMSVIIIVAILMIIIGTEALNFLAEKDIIHGYFSYFLIQSTRWIVVIAMIFFTISFIYYLAPAKRQRFRFFSAGSTLATILSLVTSLGFDFYVNNFSKYNALYGSIGTLIVIMLWIYFNASILLVGFELNASIQHAGTQNVLDKLTQKAAAEQN